MYPYAFELTLASQSPFPAQVILLLGSGDGQIQFTMLPRSLLCTLHSCCPMCWVLFPALHLEDCKRRCHAHLHRPPSQWQMLVNRLQWKSAAMVDLGRPCFLGKKRQRIAHTSAPLPPHLGFPPGLDTAIMPPAAMIQQIRGQNHRNSRGGSPHDAEKVTGVSSHGTLICVSSSRICIPSLLIIHEPQMNILMRHGKQILV